MTRRSVVVPRLGSPDVLHIDTSDIPDPMPGELRIRILAAGLAPIDADMRAGRYPGGVPRLPFVPGWDVAGVVDDVGPGASRGWLGRQVVALVLRGGHTSHLCVPATAAVPLPDGVDVLDAACLPLNYVTAYELLHRAAQVRPQERVLVRGAAGGVGTALLDLARDAGAHADGVASADDQAIVTSYDAGFIDRADDLPCEYDVVFDPVGDAARSAAALRSGGRLVAYGFLAATQARHPRRSALGTLARMRLRSMFPDRRRATFYRLSVSARRDPGRAHRALNAVIEALADGRLQPLTGRRLRLDHAVDAHRLLEQRTRGKILLLP